MPVHDGPRVTKTSGFFHGPALPQHNPEPLVQGSQSAASLLRVQSQQLLTESLIFKDEVLSGPESADHPPEEMPERPDHGKNLIGKV